MIKKIILGISLLFSTVILAQEGTASPYSFYGIGDLKFKGTNENRAMGTVGVFVDSIHVNLQNPASYSFLKYTSLTVGGSNTKTTFKTDSQKETADRTSLGYLAVGIPLGKAGVGFGLMPYTAVGYKVANTIVDPEDGLPKSKIFKGEGGLNKVFLGGAYKINPKLSIGIDVNYSFGGIETNSIVFVTDPAIALGSRTKNESTYSGFSATMGLYYHTKLKNNLEWSSSFTFSPKSNLKSDNTRNVSTVTYSVTGTEFIGEGTDIEIADSEFKLPSKLSFGTAFGKSKKWFVGTELTFQGKNDAASQGNVPNLGYEGATRFAVGGFYIPKYNSFRNYFDRIVYRAGFRHENTGLVVNDQSVRDTSMSFGFGFPVGTSISNINLGFEYGKRGTTSNGLIQENYFNIHIGLSFSDRWFVKPKYD